jgi:HSP20 family protein
MAREPQDWMWSEAVAMLARAERLHGRFFQLQATATRPRWEPPVDVMETDTAVLILIALPGVAPDQVEAVLEGASLVVSGRRILPRELQTATIHRLELPQGHFERRIPVPPGRYDGVHRTAQDGCLLISLHKAVR